MEIASLVVCAVRIEIGIQDDAADTFATECIPFLSVAFPGVCDMGEEILLVLIPVLGMLSYRFFLPIVAAIIGLLIILIFCYRQTIAAYPQGGGAYIVAHENLGQTPGLVAGGALIIGYVLTVAVSACAGAAAITSAFPQLLKYKALLAFAVISLLTWGNLRGLRESSVMFGVPTYIFILTMISLIITGLIKYALGLYTPEQQVVAAQQAGDTLMFVILRAFASGCTALTGVEAVSNGVPNFKEPTVKNAKTVLYAMAGFVALVFFGVSALINLYRIQPNSEATAVSQLAGAVFGHGSAMYFVVQIMTVIILALAANTAYAGMPLLTALMAKDLFASSSILVFAFNGDQHLLLPLYASGVFISFLLNQYGMVVHWVKEKGHGWKIKAVINGFGTVVTGITLVVIVIVKFLSGAWVTLVCIIGLVYMMRKIRKHYVSVAEDLKIESTQKAKEVIRNVASGKVILPIQSLNRSFLKTLNCALGCGFTEIEIYHISDNKERAEALKASIEELGLNAVFYYDITPYRNMNEVLLKHVEEEADKLGPNRSLVIMMGMLVVTKQLEKPLHNQTTQRLMKELETYQNVSVFTVPYLI